ncbi:hypothetical protein MATL_G00125480 [Megalops atlanticus]|uniref:Fucolectin tachylectin-4 pentraxin-1 domain-containing protein n=1 Tax=Megalops atlanticus TaxID=7932 RepID=A0A9D3PUJ3_MEGAT|nr:hypothetical protein MATL_G00125480 [Megalops atlanticus]
MQWMIRHKTRPTLPVNTDCLADRMKAVTAISLLQILGLTLCSTDSDDKVEIRAHHHHTEENVAIYGKATQSSLLHGGGAPYSHASNAIDGNTEATFHMGTCTHTDTQNNPWWRVDLLRRYRITSVSITNRKDCCAERINGAQIRIGDSLDNNGNSNPLCAVVGSIPAGWTQTFHCSSPMVGRLVNVFLPGYQKVLTLCEVQASAVPIPVCSGSCHNGR